jgi:DNA invertase Pin-like site-specific DNA recombinase
VVAEYADEAVSGAHTNREQLRTMLRIATSAERCPFRAVIVDDLSRLSREIGDTHAIIFRDLAGAGVKVMDTGGLDSESDSGEMTVAMRSIINREYVRSVSKQTHRRLTGRAIAGYSTGGSMATALSSNLIRRTSSIRASSGESTNQKRRWCAGSSSSTTPARRRTNRSLRR